MRTRLEELKIQVLPRVIKKLAERSGCGSVAACSSEAGRTFDAVVEVARAYCLAHREEARELRDAHVMQFFIDIGLLPLEALQAMQEILPDRS